MKNSGIPEHRTIIPLKKAGWREEADIDITVDEWKAMLADDAIITSAAKDMVFKWYREPGHQSSIDDIKAAYDLMGKEGKRTNPFSFPIRTSGRRMIEFLDRFEVRTRDDKKVYWILFFEKPEKMQFRLRSELIEAVAEMPDCESEENKKAQQMLDREVDAYMKKEGKHITESRITVLRRVGQAAYRRMLSELWKGKCSVTGIGLKEVLRASHAKPWSDSTESYERLDPYNGFFLAVHLDALFDKGLISFTDDGSIMISSKLDAAVCRQLHVTGDETLRMIHPKHLPYLHYHREHIFKKNDR